MKASYRELEKAIGYRFKNKKRLNNALTHPSFRFEREGVEGDNQRLEFLGDAAIGLVCAAYLYTVYPNMQEGELTKLRSRVASKEPLAEMAKACGMGEYLLLGKGENQSGGRYRESNLSDVFEAVVGAAYEEAGLKAVQKIFSKVMAPCIDRLQGTSEVDNPKGRLQELSQQRWKTTPKYRVVSEDGPSHNRVFTVEVRLHDCIYGTGRGGSKRTAQSRAAREALQTVESLNSLPSQEEQADTG